MLPYLIRRDLSTRIWGQFIEYAPTMVSTNLRAKELAGEGALEGTVVIAEFQTSGRGRLGRKWYAPRSQCLTYSLLFRPPFGPREVFFLTMLVSVVWVEVIGEETGLPVRIKWPNDLYLKGKKLAGVLTEFSTEPDRVEYCVVGIGLNVLLDPRKAPAGSGDLTSLKSAGVPHPSRLRLLQKFLSKLEIRYQELLKGDRDELFKKWEGYSLIKGKKVRLISLKEQRSGQVLGFTPEGGLRFLPEKGPEEIVISGEISLRLDRIQPMG
jgi:BirA family biotin operon repressor/biotin-[acetyl-CoA-carboxylase] ligase